MTRSKDIANKHYILQMWHPTDLKDLSDSTFHSYFWVKSTPHITFPLRIELFELNMSDYDPL